MSQEKRYLVYKSWNGQIYTSIEYGNLTNGEGIVKPDPNELKRIEINSGHKTTDIKVLKLLYPLDDIFKLAASNKEIKNETAVNS